MNRANSTFAATAPTSVIAVAVLLLALVFTQGVAVVHAGDHLFHDTDELCLAFHSVEKQPGALGSASFDPEQENYAPARSGAVSSAAASERAIFHARAPPVDKDLSA